MKAIFADTAFYVALVSPRDALHQRAADLVQTIQSPVVTTEFILVEVANFLLQGDGRSAFVELVGELRCDQDTVIVPSTTDAVRPRVGAFQPARRQELVAD